MNTSDFLLCGPGVWWKDNGNKILDGPEEDDFKAQGPSLQHFRSSNMKMIETSLADCWKRCIQSKVSMPITTLRIYDSSGDLALCLTSNEASKTQCQQAASEKMDQDVQTSTTLHNTPEIHEVAKNPLTEIPIDNSTTSSFPDDASAQTDTDEPESTLVDVRETTESFSVTTTSRSTVSSTPPSHSTQYEPKIMLGKQVVQLLDDKRLSHKFLSGS